MALCLVGCFAHWGHFKTTQRSVSDIRLHSTWVLTWASLHRYLSVQHWTNTIRVGQNTSTEISRGTVHVSSVIKERHLMHVSVVTSSFWSGHRGQPSRHRQSTARLRVLQVVHPCLLGSENFLTLLQNSNLMLTIIHVHIAGVHQWDSPTFVTVRDRCTCRHRHRRHSRGFWGRFTTGHISRVCQTGVRLSTYTVWRFGLGLSLGITTCVLGDWLCPNIGVTQRNGHHSRHVILRNVPTVII